MRNALRSHKIYVPLITILGSALLFFLYYAFYVSWQRKDADGRAFRLLSAVCGQLAQHFTNVKNIMAAAYVSGHPTLYLERYLKVPASNITGRPGSKMLESSADRRNSTLRLKLIEGSSDFSVRAELLAPGNGRAAGSEFCGTQAALCADLALDAQIHDLIHKVTDEYFDDLLIVTASGRVVFQESTSGPRINNLNSLLRPKPQPEKQKADDGRTAMSEDNGTVKAFSDVAQFSNVVDVKLAGTNYKLYVQPMPIAIPDSKGQDIKPVVCGLWRSDRLQSEVVSIPYSVLTWTALGLLSAFALVWPLLKVAYMSPSERLRRTQVFHLLFSAVLVTALLTLVVLNWSYSLRDNEETDEQLGAFADRIDHNVKTEIVRALALLASMNADERLLHDGLRRSNTKNWMQPKFLAAYASHFEELHRTKETAYYPYFDICFWVDGAGRQQFKIAVDSVVTPATSVEDEEFFRAVIHEQGLGEIKEEYLADAENNLGNIPGWKDLKTRKFRLEPIYSRNTGIFSAILAVPYAVPAAWHDLPANARNLKVQVLVTRFLSLVNPVVPKGFGYAIIDQSGEVQFHSIAARSKSENFFTECRQDHTLEALVAQRSQDFLTTNYLGKERRMLVRPMGYLAEPAYSLVVFRDSNYFSTIHVACILVFALLACVLVVPGLAAMATYVFRRRDYPLASLWPAESAIPRYLDITFANACLTAAFWLRFPTMQMNETLIALVLTAGVAVLFASLKGEWANGRRALVGKAAILAVVICVANRSPGLLVAGIYIAISIPSFSEAVHRRASRFVTLRQVYVAVAFSLLTVSVALPCFGLFRISYNTVNRLALQSAQLARRDLLYCRSVRVRQRFQELLGDADGSSAMHGTGLRPLDSQPLQPNKLLAETFAGARLKEDLDRYDNPVFNPDPANWDAQRQSQVDARPDIGWLEPLIARATTWFPANGMGAALRQVALGNRDKFQPTWATRQSNDDQLLWLENRPESPSPESPAVDPLLLGVYPLWQLPGPAAVLLIVLAALLASWLYYLIRRIFVTELKTLPALETWKPAEDQAGNLLIIGGPKSGKSRQAAALPHAHVLDIAEMATTGGWALPAITDPAVVVDHFEFDMDNPDTCLAKLRLLEQLLYVEKRRLILVSAVDPMFCLVSSNPDMVLPSGPNHDATAPLLGRWSRVLSQLRKLQVDETVEDGWRELVATNYQEAWCRELVHMMAGECQHTAQLRQIGLAMLDADRDKVPLTHAEFMQEMLERADAYYRVLWATCTKTERLALYQLAEDGWANPKNERAIQQLLRRRLIVQDSGLRIMNRTFHRFVQTVQRPEEVARWEEEEEHSTWGVVKLALGTAAVTFGAWLLYSRRDVFQVGIGYVATIAAASGAIMTLVRNFTGRSTPSTTS